MIEDVYEDIVHGEASFADRDHAALGTVGFLAPESSTHFRALCETLLRTRGVPQIDDATIDLFETCAASPSPDTALLNLRRYLDQTGGVAVFMGTIAGARPLLDMVTTVFGASQYMSDIIIRNPSTIYWLMESSTWTSSDSVEGYTEWLLQETAVFQSTEAKLDAVRRAHRQALLKIGILDMVHGQSVEDVTARLSNLADAVTDVVLGVIAAEVGVQSEEPIGLAVVALGKLGGGELNYSSDIDLIYVLEDEHADDGAITMYTKVARRLTDALSELTPEGYLYRVDLRLRPDGRAGPIVNPESALRVYYENRGRPWEFQAMLKARVVAGNRPLGDRLIGAVQSLALNPSLSYSPLDDIARMREQIKVNIPKHERGQNIKLMAGGIRDIEFVAQALQLMHGQHHPELRTTNTLDALAHIRGLRLIEGWQVDNLVDAYRFFRLVEHRLQMMHQIKTHTIPESAEEMALLARRASKGPLGDYSADAFAEALSRHLSNVRTFADGFFGGEDTHPHSVLLMLREGDERADAIIGQYGIRDVKRAMRVLHGMAYGSFPRLLDRATRAAFEDLLPLLLEGVSGMGDPDQALVHTSQIAAAGRSEASFYRLLVESEVARNLVLGVAGFSSLLTRRLCTQIGALDTLLQTSDSMALDMEKRRVPARDLFDASEAETGGERAHARLERQRAWFDRASLLDFALGYRDRFQPMQSGAGRSRMAMQHLAAALDNAVGDEKVALFVLGSYAVEEPRLQSDVDAIVVSDGADIPAVTGRVQLVNGWFTDGGILKLDFRLRGEGASAPLVQDLPYYESYLETRMSLWERIAFAKCRAWWGDAEVQGRFMERLGEIVARPFRLAEVAKLSQMRGRVESLAPRRFPVFETKRSAGGRYDVEYMTAIGLAAGGGDFFAMSTRERIEHIQRGGVLTADEARECKDALDMYGLVEYLMELQELTHPTSEARGEYLGSYLDRALEFLGVANDGGIAESLGRHKRNVRRAYEGALQRLS
jgi:glutamate-ammonia-ligase adenylyltransferase